MKTAVIRFPGSNCERDAFSVLESLGMGPHYVWHADGELPKGLDLVVIPGGFTYGDYLRCGAMAAHSPIMREVWAFAERGGYVLGICNGFQILCEAGMLPGTLRQNDHLRFNCDVVHLRVERHHTAFTAQYKRGQVLAIPVAHHEGSYYADYKTLQLLQNNEQVLFRYCDVNGLSTEASNPNGSTDHIAGICNYTGNILGMMPHPERHADAVLGGEDGRALFESLKAHFV